MIRVEHLTKRFGPQTAVADVSFSIRTGEVYALLGPNGGGKTTTLKCLVGLHLPTAGRMEIHGLDTIRHPTASRQCLSFLPQHVVFPENQTAREILEFFCRLRNIPRGRVHEALEGAGLSGAADRSVSEFSGGMRQRLGLAVAALPEAPVLILDEPTANLDPHGVKSFREFILRHKEAGRTILFSTHLLHEAEQLADRVGIVVDGRLAAEVSTDTLRRTFDRVRSLEDLYLHFVGLDGHAS